MLSAYLGTGHKSGDNVSKLRKDWTWATPWGHTEWHINVGITVLPE